MYNTFLSNEFVNIPLLRDFSKEHAIVSVYTNDLFICGHNKNNWQICEQMASIVRKMSPNVSLTESRRRRRAARREAKIWMTFITTCADATGENGGKNIVAV